MRFVPLLPSSSIPSHEKTCITTVVGLYHLTQFLAPSEIRKQRKKHKIGPTNTETANQIFASASEFWDALKKHVPPILEVLNSNPADELSSKYRREDGGNILFRTVGLAAFSRAARVMMDSGTTADEAVQELVAKTPLDLAAPIWREVLWRPETKTILHKYVRLAHNVMLYRVGAYAGSRQSLAKEYYRITGHTYRQG